MNSASRFGKEEDDGRRFVLEGDNADGASLRGQGRDRDKVILQAKVADAGCENECTTRPDLQTEKQQSDGIAVTEAATVDGESEFQ
ncbi:hypothetical protein Nepgr_030387 [Nepenthes gracilis]|uniref:Uncharacterized protein n=1 Tax=Nepenthes gracilis TaxID=150966 RepID=A0AAD3Y607_NEPGR|nr:hypothetical protein Nepgr_030387 [Nepenthes gracilis]